MIYSYNYMTPWEYRDLLRQLLQRHSLYADKCTDIVITYPQKEYFIEEYLKEIEKVRYPIFEVLQRCRNNFSDIVTNIDILMVLKKRYTPEREDTLPGLWI